MAAILLLRSSFLVLVLGDTSGAQSNPPAADARLNAVYFVDEKHGWVAGDRGAILGTADSGRTWQLEPTGTFCSLRSVSFANEQTGWVVGGQGLPYSPHSSGLVLGTSDGGRSWRPLSWGQLPRLHRVQAADTRWLWAWGEASDLFPSGLFRRTAGGGRWHPVGGSSGLGWLAGAFFGQQSGVLGGAEGVMAVVSDRAIRLVPVGGLGARSVRAITASDEGTLWAVGDGGLILHSQTQGASWKLVTPRVAPEYRDIFDWRGIHVQGGRVWIVGRPGTVVLHSPDSGATWELLPTGQSLPLEAVWFHDRRFGWAVGALGTILATRDGGHSWQAQRSGGRRAAVLTVHGQPQTAPLLAHVQLGSEQGYRCVDLAMVSPLQMWHSSTGANSEARLVDAVNVAGGAEAEVEWRFGAHPVALSLHHVLEEWNRRREGAALKELERRLVIALRMWRPEVVLGCASDPAEAPNPASALVGQVLERAYRSAAAPAAFPELLDMARLPPWEVKKLYFRMRDPSAAKVRIEGGRLSPVTGGPLDDRANLATALLAESFRLSPPILGYRLASSRLSHSGVDQWLMAGTALEPGGPARRPPIQQRELSEEARQAEQARRNLWAMVRRFGTDAQLAHQLSAELDELLQPLAPMQAGHVLFQLARRHFMQGRWADSRDLLDRLQQDYPNHLAAAEAQRWLVQFYASSEAQHREGLRGLAQQVVSRPTGEKSSEIAGTHSSSQGFVPPVRIEHTANSVAVGGLGSNVQWAEGAVEVAKRLAEKAPLAWTDPRVQFPLAAARRQLGHPKDADRFYTTFALGRQSGPWHNAAKGERWIRDGKGQPPKSVIISRLASTRPRLDGAFEDKVWKGVSAVPLRLLHQAEATGWKTEIRITHDDQFLYFALTCESADGDTGAPLRPRTRDSDLSAHDRVHLYLDINRDYATYYHLAMDQRGCVFEDCWGDPSWNPTWYVASRNTSHAYHLEAAIPLAQLTDSPVRPGTVWAFGAVRIVPGKHIMTWSRPAGLRPKPEGFGYLLFTGNPSSRAPQVRVAN